MIFIDCAYRHSNNVVLEHILVIEHFVEWWALDIVGLTIFINI